VSPSFYNVEESETAKAQYSDDAQDNLALVDFDMGSVVFEGIKYKDKMCLYQVRNNRADDTGRLCVRNMPFVSVTRIIGNFNPNGIIGLAPNMHERSYVN